MGSTIYFYIDYMTIVFTTDGNFDLQLLLKYIYAYIRNFFLQYSNWCLQNCIIVNLAKSNFFYLKKNIIIYIDRNNINKIMLLNT